MQDSPGAALDSQIAGLGAGLLDRAGRLAADIAHANAEIEKLQWRVAVIMAVGVPFVGLVFAAMAAHMAGVIK